MTICDIRDGYTVAELADEMQRSERTIRRWIADYRIDPVGRTGGADRYPLLALTVAKFATQLRHDVSLLGH